MLLAATLSPFNKLGVWHCGKNFSWYSCRSIFLILKQFSIWKEIKKNSIELNNWLRVIGILKKLWCTPDSLTNYALSIYTDWHLPKTLKALEVFSSSWNFVDLDIINVFFLIYHLMEQINCVYNQILHTARVQSENFPCWCLRPDFHSRLNSLNFNFMETHFRSA